MGLPLFDKRQANYGPALFPEEECRRCVSFIPNKRNMTGPGTCRAVEGSINPHYSSDFFEPMNEDVTVSYEMAERLGIGDIRA